MGETARNPAAISANPAETEPASTSGGRRPDGFHPVSWGHRVPSEAHALLEQLRDAILAGDTRRALDLVDDLASCLGPVAVRSRSIR